MIEVDIQLAVGSFSLDVAFENGAGVTALFGQSGSGKSLTLAIIAGIKRPDSGYVRLDGKPLVDQNQSGDNDNKIEETGPHIGSPVPAESAAGTELNSENDAEANIKDDPDIWHRSTGA